MEKKIIKAKVGFDFHWTYGIELKKIKEDLETLEKLGVTEIDIKVDDDYGCHFVSIEAFVERLETDEEFDKRIVFEKKQKEEITLREMAQLERLKKKYQNNQ